MTTAKRNLTTPRWPVRRDMEYQNATPDGRTLLESIKTVQRATLAELRTIIEEARNYSQLRPLASDARRGKRGHTSSELLAEDVA